MKNLFFIFLSILLISCQKEKKVLVTVDIDRNPSEKRIYFEDIADNFKWVALETQKDILLETYTQYWVNNKYIVAIGQNNIHQFDKEGNYIRKLVTSGKGPEEYLYLSCYTVDNEKDIFYFTHSNDRDNIICIDLNTGEHRKKINVKEWGQPVSMIIHHSDILCFGNSFFGKDTTYIAYVITPLGEVKESIIEIPKEKDRSSLSISLLPYINYIKGKNEHIQYYKSDTIYNLKFPSPEPIFGITYTSKFNADNNPEGTNISFNFQTGEWYILKRTNINYQAGDNDNYGTLSMRSTDTYLINKENYELAKVKDIFVSPLDNGYSASHFNVNNNFIYMPINAFKFKETIEKFLEKEKDVRENLKVLASKLTEDDNPVLLIGEIK